MAPRDVVDLTLSDDDEPVASSSAQRTVLTRPAAATRSVPGPSTPLAVPRSVPAPGLTDISDRRALETEARRRREERMGQDAEAGPSAPKRIKVHDTSRPTFGSISSGPTAGPSGSSSASASGASDFELPDAIAEEPGKIRLMMSGWTRAEFRNTPVFNGDACTLKRYCTKLDSVECNGTGRVENKKLWLPDNNNFASWKTQVPKGFKFGFKLNEGLTHYAKFSEEAMDEWMPRIEHAHKALGSRCGPMLVLIPPSMKNTAAQRDKLETFLGRCPDRLRVAVEFRDASWQAQEIYDLLEQYDAALVVVDSPGVTTVPRVTASFVYARLHGTDPVNKFAGLYSEQQLALWARRLRCWASTGRDVAFNNEFVTALEPTLTRRSVQAASAHNIMRLKELVDA